MLGMLREVWMKPFDTTKVAVRSPKEYEQREYIIAVC